MRWLPFIGEVAILIACWAAVLWSLGRRRSNRLHTRAAISAMVGATWFVVWLISDATGPHWLHTLSLPAALIFIAAGAVLAGYAGWMVGP